MKEWSRDSVAIAHGYNRDISARLIHHEVFLSWLSSVDDDSVFDVGCCSGIVLNHIGDKVSKYFGIDLSSLNVDCARDKFKDSKFRFEICDIEENFPVGVGNDYRICYIDSVITMLEDPNEVLSKLVDEFKYVFLNRTAHTFEVTKKLQHVWGGMQGPSTLWNFSESFFRDISSRKKVEVSLERVSDIPVVIFKNGRK